MFCVFSRKCYLNKKEKKKEVMFHKSLNTQNLNVGYAGLEGPNLVDHSVMRTFLRLNMIPIKRLLFLTSHVVPETYF